MSLIFDGFPDVDHAKEFADDVTQDFGLRCAVYATAGEAQRADPFPFALTPPIVHVERPEGADADTIESEIEATAAAYEGRFAGT